MSALLTMGQGQPALLKGCYHVPLEFINPGLSSAPGASSSQGLQFLFKAALPSCPTCGVLVRYREQSEKESLMTTTKEAEQEKRATEDKLWGHSGPLPLSPSGLNAASPVCVP